VLFSLSPHKFMPRHVAIYDCRKQHFVECFPIANTFYSNFCKNLLTGSKLNWQNRQTGSLLTVLGICRSVGSVSNFAFTPWLISGKMPKIINMPEAVGQENLHLLWDPKFIIIMFEVFTHWTPFRLS